MNRPFNRIASELNTRTESQPSQQFERETWAIISACRVRKVQNIAKELASCGTNLLVVDANPDCVRPVLQDLESRYSIETEVLQMDRGASEAAGLVDTLTAALPVSTLVLCELQSNSVLFKSNTIANTLVDIDRNIRFLSELSILFFDRFHDQGFGQLIFCDVSDRQSDGSTSVPDDVHAASRPRRAFLSVMFDIFHERANNSLVNVLGK